MKTITVNFAKWRSILMLFVSVLYSLVACSWIFVSWMLLFLVIPVLLFLGWNIRRAWRELRGERLALIIDKEGLVDNTHWYSLGRVEWEEIDSIKTKQLFFIQHVEVIFKDPSRVIQKEKNSLKKLAQSIRLLLNKPPMLLNNIMLEISHNELATILGNIDFENPNFLDMSEHLID
jgi:hypothetical protein